MAAPALIPQPDLKATVQAAAPERAAVSRRRRILIAAAVAAALGSARIVNIRPAAWTRRRPAGVRSAPTVRHRNSPTEAEPEEEPEEAL